MIEMTTFRKSKITLSDYDYQKDIENRHLMSQFSALDLEVLEEILYSSLTLSLKSLAKTLKIEKEKLLVILEKLKTSGLLTINDDTLIIDKEMRKYYEFQILKFDENFKPGMEFFLGLLRKVPIQTLPTWYSIPRTSNNILDSLIEKYFITPQIYQRYLMDLNFSDPLFNAIIEDVFNSPNLELPSKELIEKHGLSRAAFDEILLHLEFSFVCCISFKKVDDSWQEVVSPFNEWRQYQLFLRNSAPPVIHEEKSIERTKKTDFAFVEELSNILQHACKEPIALKKNKPGVYSLTKSIPGVAAEDEQRAIAKLIQLKLADIVSGRLYALESANDWLDLKLENRALSIFRHPFHRFDKEGFSPDLFSERALREAEKSITRVAGSGWVYFDDFVKATFVPLNDHQSVMLKRIGKSWKYMLPSYSDEEKLFLKTVIFDYLSDVGITITGKHQGRDCFCVTSLGCKFFGG